MSIINILYNIIKQFLILFAFVLLADFIFGIAAGLFPRKINISIGFILYCLLYARKNIIWALKPSTIKIHLKGELSKYEIFVFIFCLIPPFLLFDGGMLVGNFLVIPNMPGAFPLMETWQFPLYLRIIIKLFYFVSALLTFIIIPALVLWGIIVKFVKSLRKSTNFIGIEK